MLDKTEGIVLKNIKYSDSSIISKIFTKKHGLLSFMIKGVRKQKKGGGNIIQPIHFLDLDIYFKEQGNLQRIKEYKLQFQFQNLFFDLKKRSVAIFFLEVVSKIVIEKQEMPYLYDFVKYELQQLDEQEHVNPDLPLIWMYKISDLMGFAPAIGQGSYFSLLEGAFKENNIGANLLNGETSSLVKKYLQQMRLKGTLESWNGTSRKLVLSSMLKYFRCHVENFGELKSIGVLEMLKVK